MIYTKSATNAIVEVAASAGNALRLFGRSGAYRNPHAEAVDDDARRADVIYGFYGAQGRAVGSVIRMEGNVLGLRLAVEEVIVDRRPPHDKVWETLGEPRLIVIGTYRMGFEIATFGAASRLRVFIEYNYPRSIAGRMAALMLGGVYAKWCVRRMTEDAHAHFQKP